jgi:hypothetical protein
MNFLCPEKENTQNEKCLPSQEAHICIIWDHFNKLCRVFLFAVCKNIYSQNSICGHLFLANQKTDLDYPRITPPSMSQPSRSLYPTAKILPPARSPPTDQTKLETLARPAEPHLRAPPSSSLLPPPSTSAAGQIPDDSGHSLPCR